ncbi:hypothetical protein T484DRAFT_1967106, partial [Baffinella frigidus]
DERVAAGVPLPPLGGLPGPALRHLPRRLPRRISGVHGGGGACMRPTCRAPRDPEACHDILDRYIQDETDASSCPLPRARIEQVLTTARRLKILEFAPEVCEELLKASRQGSSSETQLNRSLLGRSGRRTHLLLLYAPVCRCISSNNPMLRDSLRAILEIIGWELELGAAHPPGQRPAPAGPSLF